MMMNPLSSRSVWCGLLLACLLGVLSGCSTAGRGGAIECYTAPITKLDLDRRAILGMAGTYKVTFDFEETLALRADYELHAPYQREAEELVVVIANARDYIALQHILVVRGGGETHVINHWRQDWHYEGKAAYGYAGDDTWAPITFDRESRRGAWVQSVYNVADSPRYASIGRWTHHNDVSTWVGGRAYRPLPLRELHLRDEYAVLASFNTHVVTARGWLHVQQSEKLDRSGGGEQAIALERGVNRYERVPDQGFEKAHAYWANTWVFWAEVRDVWSGVLDRRETITLAERWKGDTLYTHLFGLADEYWDQDDASSARPRIEEIINGFVGAD